MPPYSIPVSATATSRGANEALRTSSSRRTTPFTSARVVASTMHAANLVSPPRRPLISTQLADSARPTPYRSQNAAVSARSGSISATLTWSARPSRLASAAATAGASRSGRSSAGAVSSSPICIRTPLSCHHARPRQPAGRRARRARRVRRVRQARRAHRAGSAAPAGDGRGHADLRRAHRSLPGPDRRAQPPAARGHHGQPGGRRRGGREGLSSAAQTAARCTASRC